MKLRIFFTLTIFYVLNLQAQKGFRIGPTAGFLSSRLVVNDSIANNFNFRFKSGFNAGVNMYYGFTPNFGLNLNVLATSKGYRLFNDSNKNGNILKHNQTHIEIPFHFVFKQRLNSLTFFRLNFGGSISHMLSSDKKDLSNKNGSFRISETTKSTTSPLLSVGLEVGSQAKSGNVFLFGVFYRQAFTKNTLVNVYNNKTSTTPRFDLSYRGSYIGISLTYLFNLGNLKKQDDFFY